MQLTQQISIDISKFYLIIFAFSGTILSQIIHYIEESVSVAVNSNMNISNYLHKNQFIIIKGCSKNIILPIVLLSITSILFFFQLNEILLSSLFALSLLTSIIYRSVFPKPGIIPISWSIIYSLLFGSILYLYGIHRLFIGTSDLLLPLEVIKVIISFIVVLATIVGACMTILWTMDPKNLQGIRVDTSTIDNEKINTLRGFSSLYMVTLFTFILIGILFWIGFPLYNVFVESIKMNSKLY